MPETNQLLVYLLLFVLLPIWSIAGFADWLCHRASHIESTSGLKESLMHSTMGLQVGIPIILCLQFEINVLVLLCCCAALLLHELVAHWDVHYANDIRHISVWEMHAHSYLATLPVFMLALVCIVNWPVFLQLITLDWHGHMSFNKLEDVPGGTAYFPIYMLGVFIFGFVPYLEENIRCLRVFLKTNKT